jgi:hypothetical protein
MSIFDAIKDAIFGKAQARPAPSVVAQSDAPASSPGETAPASAPIDVEAVLAAKAAAVGKPSNWRVSIVDLMNLLGLDSSRQNRTELARELGYDGDVADSAKMNVWLHKQVMRKLAENGGKVPAELRT